MTPRQISDRAKALWHDQSGAISREWLCTKVAYLEADMEDLRGLVADMLKEGDYRVVETYGKRAKRLGVRGWE